MKAIRPLLVIVLLLSAGAAAVQDPATSGGLVSYWSFDGNTADGAWLYAANSGVAEDNLKSLGGPPQYLPGKVGRAILLDGSHLAARFSPDVALGPSYTIEAWIKPARLEAGWHRFVLNWGSEKGYHFAIHDKQVSLYHCQGNGEEPHPEGGTVVEGTWQHIAAVADENARRLTVYLDGKPVANLPYDGTINPTTHEGLGVGDSAGGPGEDSKYVGCLDELAIWNRPLSDAQVEAHYRNPQERFGLAGNTFRPVLLDDKPEGYWQLDESDGSAIGDASGNGHEGTCRGAVVLGRPGIPSLPGHHAAELDGRGACIDLGDLDAIDGLEALSVEAWVRWREPPGGLQGVAAFLRKEQVFAFGAGWYGDNSASNTSRKARFWINSGGRWLHSDNGTTDVDDGRWHHVAGVYDGKFLRIYVDGIQESAREVGSVALSSNANRLFIGSAGGGGEFYPGLIDEAAVYTRALSATEVYEHYVFGSSE